MATKAPRRLGRPPASSSAETRRRMLDLARQTFAELGWEVTTNNLVAQRVDVTSAALYHYFDSKLDMWLAVYDDAQDLVGKAFAEASASSDTFVGKFEAMLETAHALNRKDPSLASFLASARIDYARHPELLKALRRRRRLGDDIVAELVDAGVATGEISRARRAEAAALVKAILIGLTDGVSDDLKEHRAAIEGVKALLQGDLITNGKK